MRENGAALEEVLPGFLRHQRWFGGKARRIKEVELRDAIPIRSDEAIPAVLVLAAVEYTEGSPDRYAIPVARAGWRITRWVR